MTAFALPMPIAEDHATYAAHLRGVPGSCGMRVDAVASGER